MRQDNRPDDRRTAPTRRLPAAVAAPGSAAACVPCAACTVRPLTLCAPLAEDALPALMSIQTRQAVAAGGPIFNEGEPAAHLYTITAGAVKVYKLLADGRRQITGFLFAADVLGLAGADGRSYVYSAEAITAVHLCRFPRHKLDTMLEHHPELERQLRSLTATELASAQDQMLLLGRKTARERIATLLLQLSHRAALRGAAADPVHLPMSRTDMADHLGLTTETVSRTITRLKRDRVITLLAGNRVRLTDRDALDALAVGS